MSMGTAPAIPGCAESHVTGLADAVLAELLGLVQQHSDVGEESTIDLRSLPMTDADRELLKERLGTGEVSTTINAAGLSIVEETTIPGVWWVRHEGGEGRVAAEQIAVTRIPEILLTHPDDIASAPEKLSALIHSSVEQNTPERSL